MASPGPGSDRSLANQGLLEFLGIPRSRIAVAGLKRDGFFESHAWVEWHGGVVLEPPAYVATYFPMTEQEGSREPPLPHGLR